VIEQILELARWAPSGDNTQPWRFELTGEHTLVVHGFDTREHCVYDFEGHPSQISIGAMLETLRIAATGHRMQVKITRRAAAPDDKPAFDVRLVPDDRVEPSPLIAAIVERAVQRRAMRLLPLTGAQKSALEASVGADYRVIWRESLAERLHMARLLFRSAGIRLTMPEAYRVHRDVIEFNAKFSADRIPDQAIGLDPVTTRTMQWMMASWSRVKFFNTFLGGTLLPRVELDLIPGVACAAHFVIVRAQPPSTIDDFVDAGGAVQRFWLTATREQLFLQPEMTPLIFGWYTRAEKRFSTVPALWAEAISLVRHWTAFFGEDIAPRAVFCGRLGVGPRPTSRSLRLPLSALIKATQ
jgi:sulfur-carrier protein adenylyltransferase/sulfurtransferase